MAQIKIPTKPKNLIEALFTQQVNNWAIGTVTYYCYHLEIEPNHLKSI